MYLNETEICSLLSLLIVPGGMTIDRLIRYISWKEAGLLSLG
jgi:hypothetical protein